MASTVWKGRLNFGLVSIPIKLFRAARAEKIHMHKLHRETGTRVRQVFLPAGEYRKPPQPPQEETSAAAQKTAEPSNQTAGMQTRNVQKDEPIPTPQTPASERSVPGLSREEIATGFEYDKDKYVEFAPEELKQLAPKNSAEMEIVEFVLFGAVDPVYLETSYYVVPDAGGDRPYALLFEALKQSGRAAIGRCVMYRRDQIMILRPGKHGLVAHTMFYQDEVRSQDEYHTEVGLAGEKELQLALKLVDALAGAFQPDKFKDQYRERLQEAIAKKVEHQPLTGPDTSVQKSGVVDIMAALQESLNKARKPVASETRPSKGNKRKRAGGA